MPCNEINQDGMKMMLCSRGGRKCHEPGCGRPSEYQCDYPIGRYKSGKRKGQLRDCNRHLCSLDVIHGITPGIDFCREHGPMALEAYKRRLIRDRLAGENKIKKD